MHAQCNRHMFQHVCVSPTLTHLGLGGDIMGAFNQLYLPQRLTPSGIVLLSPLMVLV